MSTNQVSNRSLGAVEGAGWKGISTAPFDRDLELAVIDRGELHALVFACRRFDGSWINAETNKRIEVLPTHWREWGRGQGLL